MQGSPVEMGPGIQPRPPLTTLECLPGGHGLEPPKPGDVSCSPTWAQPSSDGASVFVACNKSSEIVEIDAKTCGACCAASKPGPGVYNLAVTKDGKLIADQ